jgi:hypothetical protein
MPDSSQSQPLEAPVDFSPQSESDKFIYSPGDPQVPGAVKPGASMAQGPMQPPAALEQALPLLHQASLDPEAPPQTQALLGILAYHANASRA